MLGRLNGVIICDIVIKKVKVLGIIKKKNILFVVEVKGYIDEKYINDYINFLLIIRNLDIIIDEKIIGSFMYNYMKLNNLLVDQKQRKLIQLVLIYN